MKRRLFFFLKCIGIGSLATGILLTGTHFYMQYRFVDMPGKTYDGTSQTDQTTIATAGRLRSHVEVLANDIGGRSIYNITELDKTRNWVVAEFRKLDLEPKVQTYRIEPDFVREAIRSRNKIINYEGKTDILPIYGNNQPTKEVANIWVEIKGRTSPNMLIVVGAHYDTITSDCPGADDNSTGIAGLFEIARYLKENPPQYSVILVALTCEEHPVGGTDKMGSAVFATWLLTNDTRRPVGMIALDMLGFFSNDQGSQQFPLPFSMYYPETANFIGFVGDLSSRNFIRSIVARFRQIPATIPSQGVAAPIWLVPDVLHSDHEYFVLNHIPGLMVTDTANFRNKDHHHKPTDTPEKLDFIKFARLVEGISLVIQEFEDYPSPK